MPHFQIILMLLIVGFLLLSLYLEWFRPAITFFIAGVALVACNIISPEEALHGFANEQLAVIVLLLIISDMIRKASAVESLLVHMMGKSMSLPVIQARLTVTVASLSAFFNNTPLVAMMMPFVDSWSRKSGISPSKLLMPLSFAAILGGCITLIGTSTNLIVNGLAVEAGYPSLGIFDFAPVGLATTVLGVLYMIFFGGRILPDHKDSVEDFVAHSRDYFVEAVVQSGSRLVGKSVGAAGLRNLKGLFLIEIVRQQKVRAPVSPDEVLEVGDKLIFTGATDAIEELTQPSLGLSLPEACEVPGGGKANIVEVVISHNSNLIGKMVKDSDFRAKYDAAILAVHRNGEKLSGKIGEVALQAGDSLLVLGGKDFVKRTANIPAFYVINQLQEKENVVLWKSLLVLAGVVLAIVLSMLHVLTMFTGLVIVLAIGLMIRVVPSHEIRKSIDFELIMLIALGIAFGKAMINSGTAAFVSGGMATMARSLGPFMILLSIFIVTNLLAAFITTKAAVALIFPISVQMAETLHLAIPPFILVVAFGGAASFITPVGYQTNLMVYGPGSYSFKDFFRYGAPLTIMYALVCAAVLTWTYQL
ncbi:MAG: SLC13 family permease [Flavobacteriales bacterium]|nr:SLC13 family permease [Flavobacteriales bacterium]MCB9449237.1 SLC13 family permease [Flavobacteriales bacterium]